MAQVPGVPLLVTTGGCTLLALIQSGEPLTQPI